MSGVNSVPKAASKRDRRNEVLVAATKLFVANGYMSTTMDDIAHAVTLNKGTLYYYYASKADILFDILYQSENGRLQMLREQPQQTEPDEALARFIEDTAIYILENPVISRISMQESPFIDLWLTKEQVGTLHERHLEFQRHLLGPIKAGIESGMFADFDPRVVTESINGALTWLPRWYRPRGRMGIAEVASQFSRFVLAGLRHGAEVAPPAPAPARTTPAVPAPDAAEPIARIDPAERATLRRQRAQRIQTEDF